MKKIALALSIFILSSVTTFCQQKKSDSAKTTAPLVIKYSLTTTDEEWDYMIGLMKTSSRMKASEVDFFLDRINKMLIPVSDSTKSKNKK